VKGKWRYLCRAVDSTGATLDFLLSAKQEAAKRFLAKALGGANHPAPRVINTDGLAAYPPALAQLKAEGNLAGETPGALAEALRRALDNAPAVLDVLASQSALVLIEFQNDFLSEGSAMHSGVQKVVASTNMLTDTAKVVDEVRDLDATIMFVRLHSLKVLANSALNPMES
jgi:hypothetical protein